MKNRFIILVKILAERFDISLPKMSSNKHICRSFKSVTVKPLTVVVEGCFITCKYV